MSELAVLSLVVTLVMTEITDLVPGGIIVPFYFVLYLDDPVKMGATLLSALVALGVVRLLENVTILYGRRKFAVYIIIGLFEKILFTWFYFGNIYSVFNLSMTIGYLVPGILARQMERQGILKTILALSATVLLIRLIQIALG